MRKKEEKIVAFGVGSNSQNTLSFLDVQRRSAVRTVGGSSDPLDPCSAFAVEKPRTYYITSIVPRL
jgi:hypothetical protein